MAAKTRVYADYNATAPLRPEAREAVAQALALTGNPSSVHAEGRRARALVEGARETLAAAVGACRDDIALTSGGTEAVGAALRGAARADPALTPFASMIEHDAVTTVSGAGTWPVTPAGVVDLDWLRDALGKTAGRPLVSLMLVNI